MTEHAHAALVQEVQGVRAVDDLRALVVIAAAYGGEEGAQAVIRAAQAMHKARAIRQRLVRTRRDLRRAERRGASAAVRRYQAQVAALETELQGVR